MGGYDVGADTALEANVGADTALKAQVGGRFTATGGGTGGDDSPSAWMQRRGGPRTFGGLFLDGGTLFASPPL